MEWTPGRRRGSKRLGLLFGALLTLLSSLPAQSWADQTERRILIGLKVFPSVVAANQSLPQGLQRPVRLLVVYLDDRGRAEETATRLRELGTVRERPVRVDVRRYDGLPENSETPVAGIFLAQWLNDRLQPVLRYAREQHAVLFSPFEGDVERGVMSGLSVRDRILPYVNVTALEAAGVHLKPFFMEVARRHE